ncbi:MAG: 30S ribosomal protein S20 [Thermoguttaceae bacterium]|jgi:small subunit ribosomal protein S20
MPHSSSAKKRLRQNIARRERNRSVKHALKTQVRKVVEAVKAGNLETAQGELQQAARKLDRAAAHKVIHRNAAARTKSRLSAKLKALKTPAAPGA